MNLRDLQKAIGGLFFLPVWWSQHWYKRDPYLWTFGAWDGLRYSDNSRAMYEYVLANCPHIKAFWMTNSKEVYHRLEKEQKPVALINTPEGKKIQRESGFFFATKGQEDGAYRYMNGILYINLWHGMPLKQIGRDELLFERKETWFKRLKTAIRRVLVPWEFLEGPTISNAPFFTPFLQSAFLLPEDSVWEVGSPRNDYLVSSYQEKLIQQLDTQFHHPVKVLYMPTHRDSQHGVFNPFSKAGFDAETFQHVLEKGNILFLYKGHFYDSSVKDTLSSPRIRTIADDDYDNLYTFLKDIDILVTDYSSVYFDFLHVRKPIILFPFDEADYVAHSRPFYFDYSLMEAKRVYTWTELADCLQQKTYFPPTERELNTFCSIPAGNTCKSIVSRIFS